MNKKRRARLQKALGEAERLTNEVNVMKFRSDGIAKDIETLTSEIEMLQQDEQDAHDNLPDPIQWSERGDEMQDIADALDEARSYLEEASNSINAALNI